MDFLSRLTDMIYRYKIITIKLVILNKKKVPIFVRDLFSIEDILLILNKISKSYFLKYDVSVVALYL
jgi:hypothetical protein